MAQLPERWRSVRWAAHVPVNVANAYPAAMYPALPEGIAEGDWQAYDRLPDDVRRATEEAVEEADELWGKLDEREQFERALAGLLGSRPWCELTPTTLAGVTFGAAVTAYDLLAQDREERVRAAVERSRTW
ncbi:hypothetical protein [Micromonospora tulbaghiae]|uniref:hypothetical protein n=1 Tax=Micromonospora tulbaghiae TaxID=479978 RepID=UPI0029C36540|nr:hypothetical protein [Micromonospora tulbaghiae]MDX5461270.1 hypothetical protein [Micromonospora tulbaghiae]